MKTTTNTLPINKKFCLECNVEIPTEKGKKAKFCSRSCSAKHNNKGTRRHGIGKLEANCRQCNKTFSYHPRIHTGTFCSIPCHKRSQFLNETLDKFKNGQLGNSPVVIKKCITHLLGYVCTECKNVGVHNNLPLVLQLDHIDGDSDNNWPSNLRLLCPNCHSQTITYKSRNKNSSRAKYRRNYRTPS